MGGYYERKPTHVLKLGMVMSVNFSDDLVIKKEHLQMALVILEDAEKNMANAFAYISATSEARVSQYIIEALRDAGGKEHRKKLFAGVRHLLRNIKEFDSCMDSLDESDIVRRQTINGQPVYVFKELMQQTEEIVAARKQEQEQVQAQTQTDVDFSNK